MGVQAAQNLYNESLGCEVLDPVVYLKHNNAKNDH